MLEEIRDSQLQWHKAIFVEICAHTAFPDERARRLGLAKAERDVRAAPIASARPWPTARRERREAMASTPPAT